ncbi:uncharacterized protein LOC106440947 isoform X2 [Brassica napus]|uniref:uncharacterized protein LOC106440947 isoform X2 n=1 Tax=Brassica napus TaxID=3708 RepID=UPI0020789FDC|nr:uncharacterized protein LOC106440947 isoform X2 [Brassica napus]
MMMNRVSSDNCGYSFGGRIRQSSSSSSSSSDDESSEVKKKESGESVSEVVTVSSVPTQPIPIAGDAPFMESTANVIVESISLMDSTTPSDPKTELMIEITPVEAMISTENDESSLPKPNEIKQASSSATDSDVKENERKTWTLPESNSVPEGNSVHEEEAPVRPTHGVLQRTSWLSCCGLFDVVT